MPILQTSLCELLNIEVPIVQAPISGAASPSLVAAVSNAGGLGALALANRDADGIRKVIGETREQTDRPFCGNFLIRPQEETDERLAAALEAGVAVVAFHWNEPFRYIEQVHSAGSLAMYTVASAAAARRAVDAGIDIIVAQGWEAGGHVRGDVATMALVPRVVDAVSPTPVIAAGGIADGRGLAAALALGASGVMLGTRFLASEEATTHPFHRERVIQSSETDTLLSTVFDVGMPEAPGRALRNSTLNQWEATGRPPSGQRPGEGQILGHMPNGQPIARYRSHTPLPGATGDIEAMGLWAGQSVGLVTRVQPAGEIVREMAEEAAQVLRRCTGLAQA